MIQFRCVPLISFLLCCTMILASCAVIPLESHREVHRFPCRERDNLLVAMRAEQTANELRRQDLRHRIEALERECLLFQQRADSCMRVHGMSQAEAERAAAHQTITYVMKENFIAPERSIDLPWAWIIGGTIFLSAVLIASALWIKAELETLRL
jgi:hypothetical protein